MDYQRISVLLLFVALCGCTNAQLRRNTVYQAKTVADVHTQQVLDNLAKFANNREALPHFSYPQQGLAQVTDQASTGADLTFGPSALTSWVWKMSGSQTNAGSYTLTPINDPKKLELMRCAYQKAISGCCCTNASEACPDCALRFNKFYLGSEVVSKTGELTTGGGNVFEVRANVNLIYYPAEETGYVELPQHEDGRYVVSAERDDDNEVVYRYMRHAGFPAYQLPFGTKLYKLEQHVVRNQEEIALFLDVLKKNPDLQANVIIKDSDGEIDVTSARTKYLSFGEPTIEEVGGEESPLPTPAPEEVQESVAPELTFTVPRALAESDLERVYVDNTVSEFTKRTGRVTADCLDGRCWFEVGSKRDFMQICRKNPCDLVGEHCGTYVWVPPSGRDQLTKLTLTVLDIALNDPATSASTEVYALLDRDGKSAQGPSETAFILKGNLSRGSSPSGLLPSTAASDSPASTQAKKLLSEKVKLAREGFIQAVGKSQVADILYALGPGEAPRVEYLTSDFKVQAVDISDGDELVRVAAFMTIANFKHWDEGDGFEDLVEKAKESNFSMKVKRAQLYLDAVYAQQNFEGTAPELIRESEPQSRRSLDSYGSGTLGEIQRLQQFQGTLFPSPTF